jgi:diguanylate cyclase (GGDEF)-like protein
MNLDLSTMAVFATATNVILNLLFLYIGLQKGAAAELRFWAIAMVCNAASGLLLGMRVYDYPQFLGMLGGMLFIAYFVNILFGFQAFAGNKPSVRLYSVLPFLFVLIMLPFAGTPTRLLIGPLVALVICGLLCVRIAYELYRLSHHEKLKSIWIAISLYLAFAVALAIFAILAVKYPVLQEQQTIVSVWLGWMVLENILHKSACALIILVLVKDRSDEKLRLLAETDVLTGIRNRRAFVAEAEKSMLRPQGQFALAIFDLDHFKRINDQYGHMAGDHALQAFTECVTRELSDGMVFGRLGGEEFAIFAPVHVRDQLVARLEAIRLLVASKPIQYKGQEFALTVSIGVAFCEDSGPDLDHLMAAADCALYLAKERGRNGVCEFTPSQRLRSIVELGETKRIGLIDSRVSRRSVRAPSRFVKH